MPQKFDVDGVHLEFPDDASPEEIQKFLDENYNKQPQVSAGTAFTEQALTGVAPGAAFMQAFPAGARLGAMAGAAVPGAGETGLSEAIGAGVGGLITGGTAAWAAHKAQSALLHATVPEFAKQLDAEMAAGAQQHPWASAAGEVVSLAPTAKIAAPFKAAQLPLRLALGAGISTLDPLLHGRAPSLPDVAAGAVTTGLYGEGRFKAPFEKGPNYASSVKEAAKVYGNLRPQPVSGEGQVPVQEGGPGVQPQTGGGMAPGTQVSLSEGEALKAKTLWDNATGQGQEWMLGARQKGRRNWDQLTPEEQLQVATKVGAKKKATFLTGQRAEIGEDDRGIYIQFGNRREYGWETLAEAKINADQINTGERAIVGEEVPAELASATYTEPKSGLTGVAPHHPAAGEELGAEVGEEREERETPEFGFGTELGEVLPRDEAEERAQKTGQAMPEVQQKPGVPHSNEVKASGTQSPISETSDVDEIIKKIERGENLSAAEEKLFKAQINMPSAPRKVKEGVDQAEFALKLEAQKVKKQVDIVDKPPEASSEVPFAQNIAYIDPKSGRLVINRKSFLEKLAEIPQQGHAAYIERLVNEEHLHSKTTAKQALDWLRNSTAAEKALAFKQYTGFDTPSELKRVRGIDISDVQLGKEMIRQRMQQLSGMGVREIVELAGREKWNARFIDALQRIIFSIRKALGTEASRMQQSILNEMQGNLDAVKQAQGEVAGIMRKMPRGTLTREAKEAAREDALRSIEKIKRNIAEYEQRAKEGDEAASGIVQSQKALLEERQRDLADLGGEPPGAFFKRKEDLPELLKGDRLVSVVRPDGTAYPAAYGDKTYDLTKIGKGVVPSIARPVQDKWSHGMLHPGERIVDDGGKSALGQEAPAGAFRKQPKKELPTELGLRMMNAPFLRGLGPLHADELVSYFATLPDRMWNIPESVRDQLHAFFMDNKGSDYDRLRLIGEAQANLRKAHADLIMEGGIDEQADKLYLDEARRLENLRSSVQRSYGAEPEDYTPAAFKKETKKEREARLAREEATQALPGFEAKPTYSPILPLKGEAPPPPPETIQERAGTGFGGMTPKWLEADVSGFVRDPKTGQPVDAGGYLSKTDEPSFKGWVKDLNARLNVSIEPYQLVNVFGDALAEHLDNAPGAKLEAIAKAMGVDVNVISRRAKKEGKKILQGVPDPPEVERERMIQAVLESKPREQKPEGELGLGDLTKEDLKQIQKTREARQRFRTRVLSAIWNKAMKETLPSERALDRTKIDFEDIAWGTTDSAVGPFYKFTNREAENLQTVKALASDKWRRSGEEKETITRRLIAFVDKNTRRVEVDSVYMTRGKMMVMRPTIAGMSGHRQLETLPTTLRPYYTILLKHPVDSFHETFKSIPEFNAHYDIEEADSRQRAWEIPSMREEGEPGFAPSQPTDIEELTRLEFLPKGVEGPPEELSLGTTFRPPTQAEGGRQFIAPSGKYGPQGEFQQRASEIARAQQFPLSTREASSLMRVAMENEVSEPEDLAVMVGIMQERLRQGQGLRGDQASALSALHKIVAGTLQDLQQAWRDERDELRLKKLPFDVPLPTAKEAYEVALRDLFHTVTRSSGISDAVQTLTRDYSREARPDVQLFAPKALPGIGGAQGISREVTMRQPPPRMPPTRFPLPRTAEPALPTEPERLPPEQVPGVEAQAAREFPYAPTGAEPGRGMAEPTGRILRYGTPEFRTKSGLLGPRTEEPAGAFYKKPRDQAEEAVNRVARGLTSAVKRTPAYDMVAALRDVAANNAARDGDLADRDIRTAAGGRAPKGFRETIAGKVYHGDPNSLRGAIAVVQARGNKAALDGFQDLVQIGRLNAQVLLRQGNWWQRIKAKQWLQYQDMLDGVLNWTRDNWDNPQLQATAKEAKRQLDAQYSRETNAGMKLKYRDDYMPGRYEGPFWDDNAVIFGALHGILGRNWKAPKSFDNYFQASSEEPYLAANFDAAALAGHRVRQGMNRINYNTWIATLKALPDPVSKKPIATDAIRRPDKSYAPPDAEHVVLAVKRGGPFIAVRKSYETLFKDLTNESFIQQHELTRNALAVSQGLKHTLLAGDFFHLFRLGYYSAALQRGLPGFRKGLAAIEYTPATIDEAVKRGLVSKQDADWVKTPVDVNLGGGKGTRQMSPYQIGRLLSDLGMNNARIQDALYKEIVGWIPGLGRYNRWLFDRVTRGYITQSGIMNFIRLNKANPNLDARVLARDVAADMNAFYGNLGRQGWFKSETGRDIMRLAFLAPQWVEGLVRKETGFISRTAQLPFGGRGGGLPKMGALGGGIATGLVTMMGLTQALNLLFRRQPTWMNEEEGHKWDAFIHYGKEEEGLWFSPLSVFNELSHDVWRLINTKPKVWDAMSQIGENKLSPYGRLALVGARSQTPTGQYLTTTGGVAREMAQQLAPVPITASRSVQAALHPLVPGLVSGVRTGQFARQAAAIAGFKMEPSQSAVQRIMSLGEQFMLDNPDLKKDTGWKQIQTDEPSYSKLRSAIRNDDDIDAKRQWQALRKSRNYTDIVKAMKLSMQRPFTGSHTHEAQFLYTLSPQQLNLYGAAQEQRAVEFGKFLEFLARSEVE